MAVSWPGAKASTILASSDATPDDRILDAEYAAASGHHFVLRGVFGKGKYDFTSEVLEVFRNETTGKLKDSTSNQYDIMHTTMRLKKRSIASLKGIILKKVE